jgi:TP901 family phage tail tape measure protein
MATLGIATLETIVDLDGLNKGLVDGERQTKGWTDRVGSLVTSGLKVAVTAAAAVATAVAGIGVAGVLAFSGFQGSMNEVFTLLPGISQDAMDKMSGQVLDFSRDFAVLPEQVVPALYQSLSAGVPEDNVFAFLETAQKAAVGGVTELETAVDGISSVVNAYGSEVISAAEASDIMFTAVRLGKTDFGQLSASLFNVIPAASSLGVGFGDVAAQLAVLTGQGTPTSVATTQIRAALNEAANSSSKLAQEIEALTGKSFVDLIGEGQSTAEILNTVRESMPDQAFRELFGSVEAMNAALGITGPNFEKTTDALNDMAGAAGATDAAYETMDQGIGRAMERLKVFGNTALIEVGDALSPLVDMVLNFAEGALPKVEDVLNNAVIPAIETVATAFSNLFAQLQNGVDPITALVSFVSQLIFGFGGTSEQVQAFNNFVWQAVEAVQSFMEPIVTWIQNNVELQDILIVLAGVIAVTVLPILYSLLATIASIALPVVAAIAIVALMRQAWESDWGGIQGKVQSAVAFIQNIITTVMTAVQTFWTNHGAAIMESAQEAWAFIQSYIDTVLTVVSSIFAAFKSAFEGDWRGFGENLRKAWDAAWGFITTAFTNAKDAIIKVAAGLVLDLIAKFQDVDWGGVGTNIIQGIANGITAAAGFVADAARAAAQAALDAAKGFLGIDSPSKAFAELGRFSMEGMALGVADSEPVVTAAATRAMGRLVGNLADMALSPALVGSGNVANTDRSTNFNIYPQYANGQSEGDLRADIRLLQMMHGGAA